MKSKIKKIIAREGLIIVSFGLLGLIYCLIPDYITVKSSMASSIDPLTQSKYEIETESGTRYTVIFNKGRLNEKEIDEFVDLTKERAKAKGVSSASVEELGTIIKKEISSAKIKDKLLLVVLLGYPIYLLIRFVLWAIRTVRQKE